MMKILPLVLPILVCCVAEAQTSNEKPGKPASKIVGSLNDGNANARPADVALSPVEPSKLIRETVTTQDGKRLRIQEIKAPIGDEAKSRKKPQAVVKPALSDSPTPSPSLPRTFFQLTSTSHRGEVSRLEWGHEGKRYVAYSNIDSANLNGFTTFEAAGKHVTFMHMSGAADSSAPEGTPKLPSISKGATFKVVEGDAENKNALVMIEALHQIYDVEKDRLSAARTSREAAARARKAKPEPEEIVFRYYVKPQVEGGAK